MADCLFCRIAAGDIRADVVYEDDRILAFRDIKPQAPSHVLIIPKSHIATLNELSDPDLAAALIQSVQKIAALEGLSDDGYRTVVNCNANAGQEVYHLHFHLLGGRRMTWPPG